MLPPLEYLKGLKPFSFLSDSELKEIVDGLESEIFDKGKTIFKKGKKPVKYVYILKYGKVELNNGKNSEILTEGDMFGIASAITGNPPRFTAKALEKSVCFLIRRENFLRVFNSNQKFSEFFTKLLERRLVSLLKLSKKTSSELNMLYTAKVVDLISKKLVYCSPKTKIAEAAKIMHENRVGSIVIIENGKPVGIFTQKDLIRIVASNVPLDDEISKYMSSPVIEIDADATVMDAYLAMTSSGINHIVVVSNGDVKGVISTRDI
ncbi:CBS domain-containing protein, partial [Archaeoglobus sp.]